MATHAATQTPPSAAPSAVATAEPTTSLTTPTPKPTTAPPSATPAPAVDPPATAGPFQMDLYKPKAAVRQLTTEMCVGAAIQTMINLMAAGAPDRNDSTQLALFDIARELSHRMNDSLRGASPRGWAAGLDYEGYGDYEVLTSFSMDDVLKIAARQMRLTGKPVGLTVWRGKHAWVMSGFEATADPRSTDDFAVTAVWVEDPWFGRIDSQWGAGLAPDSLVATDDLGHDFVSWVSHQIVPNYGEARFIIVAPLS
jgi:hypothetical protein